VDRLVQAVADRTEEPTDAGEETAATRLLLLRGRRTLRQRVAVRVSLDIPGRIKDRLQTLRRHLRRQISQRVLLRVQHRLVLDAHRVQRRLLVVGEIDLRAGLAGGADQLFGLQAAHELVDRLRLLRRRVVLKQRLHETRLSDEVIVTGHHPRQAGDSLGVLRVGLRVPQSVGASHLVTPQTFRCFAIR
jgi:hypothetical protein